MPHQTLKLIKKRQRGFTFVEVAIAMSISLMAIISILSIFIASSKMAVESLLQNQVAMEARSVVDKLTTDARMAVSVEKSYSAYTADKNTLILKLPSIDADGFPVDITSKFDRVVYHTGQGDSNQLVRTVIANPDSTRNDSSKVIASGIQPGVYAVQPDPIGEFVVYYRFVSKKKFGSKDVTVPLAGSIQLRNHQQGA